MENNMYLALGLLVMAVITYLLRALPFLVFGGKRKTPLYVLWLGEVLPFAIIGMLVVYCLKNVSFVDAPFALPEIFSCAFVALIHLKFRNPLLSIGGGTALYMFIVQVIL